MKPLAQYLLTLALALMLGSCSDYSQSAVKKTAAAYTPTKQEVLIESDPPGARIEVNDEYKGTTPLTVSIAVQPNGSAEHFTRIVALPVPGQAQQSKSFMPSRFGEFPVPKRILFVMNLGTAKPAIDVNVHEQ